MKLEIFDPPMCCKTGICGSTPDQKLVTFASDLEWLKKQGVEVLRYGLSFEPAEFIRNETVKNTLQCDGNGCLPLIFAAGELVSKSIYPSRQKLSQLCKIGYNDEEAPPIHREENCCCGVDCDCSSCVVPDELAKDKSKCPREDKTKMSKEYKILLLIVLFILIAIAAAFLI